MRTVTMYFIFIANFILQSTVLRNLAILDVKPNTALVLVVCFSFLRSDLEGCFMGLFAGFLQDVFYARFIGYNMLMYAMIGFLCGKPFKDYFRENYLFAIVLTAVSSFAYEFITYVTHFMLFGKINTFFYFYRIILPSTVYTLIMVFPLYFLALIINAKLEKREDNYMRKI